MLTLTVFIADVDSVDCDVDSVDANVDSVDDDVSSTDDVELTNDVFCRTVFLRLASLTVLMVTLYSQVTCTPHDSCKTTYGSCSRITVSR